MLHTYMYDATRSRHVSIYRRAHCDDKDMHVREFWGFGLAASNLP